MPFYLPDHDVMRMLGEEVAKQRIENTRQFHIDRRKQYSGNSIQKLWMSVDDELEPELEVKYERWMNDALNSRYCLKQIQRMTKDWAKPLKWRAGRGRIAEPSFLLYCKGQVWDKGNWGVY